MKNESTNLEQCFTASITAHLISILSHLKMSFGSHALQSRRRALHSSKVQQFLNVVNSWLVRALMDKVTYLAPSKFLWW